MFLQKKCCSNMRETSCLQADFIETFNCTSGYLNDLLNIDNHSFDQVINLIHSTEANSLNIEVPFLDFNLSIN